ncbi:MAG: pilus assembly protein [Lachnospiraceae bacterium]|nr:pilus assembly protein [Lachnospiraceae bacterium]
MKGYFTLEAALLMPMVFAVYFFLFYMGFYQYDRCLAEQDLRLALLRGSRSMRAVGAEMLAETYEIYGDIGPDKYIAVSMQHPQIRISHGKITGSARGSMEIPVPGMPETEWDIEVHGENTIMDPVFLLRLWDRIWEEENGESGESEPAVSEEGIGAE